jgi:sulfoxide reductase heme-binding subunit YedZ
MIRRLGGKNWNRLHRLIYVIAILGVIHFGMAQKKDLTGPIEYGAVLAVLYGWRFVRWSRQRASRQAEPAAA